MSEPKTKPMIRTWTQSQRGGSDMAELNEAEKLDLLNGTISMLRLLVNDHELLPLQIDRDRCWLISDILVDRRDDYARKLAEEADDANRTER